VISSILISRRFKGRESQVILVNLSALLLDRLILNMSLAVCLLLECWTVVWDTLYPVQFPLEIRWPLVLLAMGGTAVSGSRIFKLYMRIANIKKIRDAKAEAACTDANERVS
jgi:hypothetical protein